MNSARSWFKKLIFDVAPTTISGCRVTRTRLCILLLLLPALLAIGCGKREKKQTLHIIKSGDTTLAVVNLGRHLFYDNNLSFNQTKSCASCHDPALAFTDGYRQSTTATGDKVLHNAPSLVNAVFQKRLDWANPGVTNAYEQNARPLFGEHPVEMGAKNNEEQILERFRRNERYQELAETAFPGDSIISFIHIRKSLAAFVNSLVSTQSAYDKYLAGDSTALSPAAKRGLELFSSQKLNCASCHHPPLFSLNDIRNAAPADSIYVNTGLYHTGKNGEYPANDPGLFQFTGQPAHHGRFKIPSLRNVAITAPYMHDGSVAGLKEVIDIYSRGGRIINKGDAAGDGKYNPYKDSRIKGFSITEVQKKELLEFLYHLTDSTISRNPLFANPHSY